jgi:hypothetical protein
VTFPPGSLVSMSGSVVNFELGQIISFYEHADARLGEQIDKVRETIEAEPKASWSQDLGGYSQGQLLEDQYVNLCDLSRLNNNFVVLMSYAVFERFLLALVGSAKLEIEQDPYWEGRMELRKYVEFLGGLGIDLKAEPFEYDKLMEFNRRRNLIMHSGGSFLVVLKETTIRSFPGMNSGLLTTTYMSVSIWWVRPSR